MFNDYFIVNSLREFSERKNFANRSVFHVNMTKTL